MTIWPQTDEQMIFAQIHQLSVAGGGLLTGDLLKK